MWCGVEEWHSETSCVVDLREPQPWQGLGWEGGARGPSCLVAVVLVCLDGPRLPWRFSHLLETQNSSFTLFSLNFFPPQPIVLFPVLCKTLLAPGLWWEAAHTHGLDLHQATVTGTNHWPSGSSSLVPPAWEEQKAPFFADHRKHVPWKEPTVPAMEQLPPSSASGSAPGQVSEHRLLRWGSGNTLLPSASSPRITQSVSFQFNDKALQKFLHHL